MDCENMRVAELKALARERGLRGYSRLRRTELIALLHSARDQGPQRSTRGLWPPTGVAPLASPARRLVVRGDPHLLRRKSNRLGPGSLVRKKWMYLNDKRCVKIDLS